LSYKKTQGGRSKRGRFIAAVAALAAFSSAMAAEFSADAVKAAYLFRFASYVEWPDSNRTDDAFVIGVVGADTVAVHLERLLAGMSVRGKPAKLRRVLGPADLDGVQILYIGPRVFRGAREMRLATLERPILLVTDNPEGLNGGGVINFIEVSRNLRFEISLEAAEHRALRIDSALLSVAARVEMRKSK
jgi:hypothetical protein